MRKFGKCFRGMPCKTFYQETAFGQIYREMDTFSFKSFHLYHTASGFKIYLVLDQMYL